MNEGVIFWSFGRITDSGSKKYVDSYGVFLYHEKGDLRDLRIIY